MSDSIYVSNLPSPVTEDEIVQFFGSIGIIAVRVLRFLLAVGVISNHLPVLHPDSLIYSALFCFHAVNSERQEDWRPQGEDLF